MDPEIRKELAGEIQQSLNEHMRASLDALREALNNNSLNDDFRAYLVLFKDGKQDVISPDEMIEVAAHQGEKILLTLHIWLYREEECLFSCSELATAEGIRANWIAKVNPEPGERDGWVTPKEVGGAIEQYFDERNAVIGQALTSGRAKAAAKDNNIDFDPGRWVSNDKASDHGAN